MKPAQLLMLSLTFAWGVSLAAPNDDRSEMEKAGDGAVGASAIWAVWGGEMEVAWNRVLLENIGIDLSSPNQRIGEIIGGGDRFRVRESGGLEFRVIGTVFDGFVAGSLQLRGGYELSVHGQNVNLRDVSLSTVKGNPYRLDVVSTDGQRWMYIDRLMYELNPDTGMLEIQAMDLRMTAEFANLVGEPRLTGYVLGNAKLYTNIFRGGFSDGFVRGLSSDRWPGALVPNGDGAIFEADVFMDGFSNQNTGQTGGADGPGGVDGLVKFTPSSTLRNNVADCPGNDMGCTAPATVPGDPLGTSKSRFSADVPWHQKFTGNFEPYMNDQHPYLIWNLYRINADGQIDQVGRSGVKHAFVSVNSGCPTPFGHILGVGCGDTYGTGNNDSGNDLGPRSEIIPATGQWGRCGSIYDRNCDSSSSDFSGYGAFEHRMVVSESLIDPAANPGATYLFESWYIVREDINIYNTMQTRPSSFSWSSASNTWLVNDASSTQLLLGPAIDRWVDPGTVNPDETNTEIDRPEGHIKVAAKTVDLGGGLHRFDYAVMNFDFGIPDTQGSEPDLRLISNDGLVSFTVPTGAGASITNLQFSDGDLDGMNDWVASVDASSVTWTAPSDASLNWGSMMRFSLTADIPPTASDVAMVTADISGTDVIFAGSLIPSGPVVPTFSVGGSVSGLEVGQTVVLGLGMEQLPVSDNTTFVFVGELENGEGYDVQVDTQPANAVCTVTDGSGVINSADVTNVAVDCQPAFAIGGSVDGLNALETVTVMLDSSALGGVNESLVLGDNAAFAFDQLLPDSSDYTVTLVSDTTANGCSLSNGTGTVSGIDIGSITVSCGQFMKDGFESP